MPTRSPVRLPVLLVCAAAPLVALTGCSSSSPDPAPSASASAPAPQPPSPTAEVRYATLPDACRALSAATVKSLVPGTAKPGGTPAGPGRPGSRGGCSWYGLHGYQYRFLDDQLERFDNVTTSRTGDDAAADAYSAAVRNTVGGAKPSSGKATTSPLAGVGDEAVMITWKTSKDHATYHNVAVVVRSANVVVTVDYTGAGLQGDHAPSADDLAGAARKAAVEALGSLH